MYLAHLDFISHISCYVGAGLDWYLHSTDKCINYRSKYMSSYIFFVNTAFIFIYMNTLHTAHCVLLNYNFHWFVENRVCERKKRKFQEYYKERKKKQNERKQMTCFVQSIWININMCLCFVPNRKQANDVYFVSLRLMNSK